MANISHFTQTVNGVSTTYDIHDANAIPKTGSNAISGDLIPSSDGTVNLGSSSKKFASLNGIAPDELGLPASTYTDVSSYITHFDSTPNTFTAPVSGLLNIAIGYVEGGIECAAYNTTSGIQVGNIDAYGHVRILFPIEQGDSIKVYVSKSGPVSAKIYHLKGKV